METKLCFLHHHHPHRSTVSSPNWVPWKSIQKPECSRRRTIRAVLTRTQDHTSNIRLTDDSIIASSSASSTTVHNDGWFDLIAINYLSQNLQAAAGIKSEKIGYEGLLEATSLISNKLNTKKQQELVIQTLERAIPSPILSLIRALIPSSKFKRELYALFTTFFFAWLVGPSQVKESEIDGRMEKNVVHIKKCRFLESSGCVGMCVNLCKIPSQKFIKDSFGMPVNMVPNFDDMSCEMIFGQDPPTAADDPALKQPCYKILCKAKKKHTSDCTD